MSKAVTVSLKPYFRLEEALKNEGIEDPTSVTKLTIEDMVYDDDFVYIREKMADTLEELIFNDAFIGWDYLDADTFLNCKGLKSVVLINAIKEIYDDAFAGCTGLKSVYLDTLVEYVSENAFRDSPEVTFTVHPDNYCFESVDGKLIKKNDPIVGDHNDS